VEHLLVPFRLVVVLHPLASAVVRHTSQFEQRRQGQLDELLAVVDKAAAALVVAALAVAVAALVVGKTAAVAVGMQQQEQMAHMEQQQERPGQHKVVVDHIVQLEVVADTQPEVAVDGNIVADSKQEPLERMAEPQHRKFAEQQQQRMAQEEQLVVELVEVVADEDGYLP
jgi:hypothetical protein